MDTTIAGYFDALPSYVTVQDRDYRVIAANRRFQESFAGGIGSYCYEAYKRRTSRCETCPIEATFRDGQPHTSEEKVTRRSGRDGWIVVNTTPVRDAAGDVVAVVEVSTDITEIKRSQRYCRVLFDESPCYVSVQDKDLRLIDVNRRFREDFGEPNAGYCYEVYKHRTEPCLVCPVAATFQDGASHSSEEIVTALDGRQLNVLTHTAPLRDEAGEIVAAIEMSTNITEIRRLQSQLTSLGMVVGSISHGIKGLLNGLGGGVYLMETGFKKDDLVRVKKGWEMLQRNVDRIRSMVLNVLYYAKDREMQRATVAAGDLVTDVAGVLAPRAQQLGVTLATEIAPALPPFSGDASALHSMLVNLAENSLDACRTDRKPGPHRVAIRVRREQADVVFEVEDDGIGMDRETREKAFSAFFSSKGTEGTGLGLFIANKIVTAHGGAIRLDSTLEVGTKFTVRIPAGDDQA